MDFVCLLCRCSAVAEHWPALVAAFNERQAAAAAKARSKCAARPTKDPSWVS